MFKHNCINALEHNFFSTPVRHLCDLLAMSLTACRGRF